MVEPRPPKVSPWKLNTDKKKLVAILLNRFTQFRCQKIAPSMSYLMQFVSWAYPSPSRRHSLLEALGGWTSLLSFVLHVGGCTSPSHTHTLKLNFLRPSLFDFMLLGPDRPRFSASRIDNDNYYIYCFIIHSHLSPAPKMVLQLANLAECNHK